MRLTANECNHKPFADQLRQSITRLTQLYSISSRLDDYHHSLDTNRTVGLAMTTTADTNNNDSNGCGAGIAAKVCKINVNNTNVDSRVDSRVSGDSGSGFGDLKTPLKCFWPKCEFKTAARDQLKQHYSVHYKCKQFCCPFKGCNKVFKYKTNLAKHKSSHQPVRGQARHAKSADTCGYSNSSNSVGVSDSNSGMDPVKHEVIVNTTTTTGTDSNDSNECHNSHMYDNSSRHSSSNESTVFAIKSHDTITAHKSAVKSGVGAHTPTPGVKPLTIGMGSTGSSRANGQSSKKEFRCEYNGCSKTFTLKTLLIQHKSVVHLNQTLYSCDYENCDQMFNKKVNLKRHKNTVHLGLKPFCCDYHNCGKKFTQKTHLLQHRRRQHLDFGPQLEAKRFKCYYNACNKSYDSIYDLKTHVVDGHLRAGTTGAGGDAGAVDDKALNTCFEQN
ncbi:unnamed protein product, partial [Oppiella nova]